MSQRREPVFNNVSPVVLAVAAAIAVISGAAIAGGAVVNARWAHIVGVSPGLYPIWSVRELSSYVAHVFAHGGWAHLGMNMAFLLALGAPVMRRLGSTARGIAAFLTLLALTAIGGAVAHAAFINLVGAAGAVMVGASTAVSGLLAAALYLMRASPQGPLPALNSERYLTALAPWLLINLIPLIMVQLGVGAMVFGGIAWMGHLGGLAAGAVVFPILDRFAHGGARPPTPQWRVR